MTFKTFDRTAALLRRGLLLAHAVLGARQARRAALLRAQGRFDPSGQALSGRYFGLLVRVGGPNR